MKNYFTMGEFARLRDINTNSLRYYEKIGILKPKKIDERTGYRYYSPNQLYHLDIIRLCIDLGIPLKEMSSYTNSKGELQSRKLFEDGKRIAKERMTEIQKSLNRIEHSLDFFETTNGYEKQTGLYTRPIKKRIVYTSDKTDNLPNVAKVEKHFSQLFEQAQADGFSPVLPSGIIVTNPHDKPIFQQFFEITECRPGTKHTIIIPSGNYLCLQINFQPEMDIPKVIKNNFSVKSESPIIVSNLFPSKFHVENIKTELQQLQTV